ncbi:MAG: hypothetical protein ABIG63_06150 [Chloroflexota bacterium]
MNERLSLPNPKCGGMACAIGTRRDLLRLVLVKAASETNTLGQRFNW